MPRRSPRSAVSLPNDNPPRFQQVTPPEVSGAVHEICEPLIRMHDIVKTYKTPAGDFQALKNVSADFHPGQFVSIIGKSGSGKSTLLNMLTGIDRPNSGTIQIGNIHLQNLSESEFSMWRGKNLGIVFQFFQLLPMLSLLENTILPMDFCNMYQPAERLKRASDLLALVGLENYLHKPPAAVSSGQEQCAAIARALANDPPIIVADEPTGNLDSRTADLVLGIIDELVARGKTILVVTHDETVASRASRIMVICDGELVNENISNTYPGLSHRTMLLLSHRMKTAVFPAGSELPLNGPNHPACLIVTEGQLEVSSADSNHRQIVATGENLSRFDQIISGSNQPILKAAGTSPFEILYLNDHDLDECLRSANDLEPCLKRLPQKSFLAKHAEEGKKIQSASIKQGVGS
jgi:putative ABC transport system ATP-binding protein